MTCVHIQKVKNFLREGWEPSSGRGERNPYCECPVGSEVVTIGSSRGIIENCQATGCLVKKKILDILNECNCVETKEWEIQELKKKAGNLENNQLVLARDKSSTETSLIRVQSENSSLSREISNLRSVNYSLSNANSSLQTTNNNLQNQLTQKDRDIEWGKNQLALVQRSEREKQTKINELTHQLTALQITNNNINREIKEKKNEIKNLKGDLNISREEYLNQKISIKEEKLETLIQQLGVGLDQIANLRNAYKQLIEARTDFNQANINAANANVNNVRAALAVNPANRQKLSRKCEKLVRLEIELNQVYKQQYEARQEVPPR